ncbi:MAG TPA: undecaprenyl-diphosphate phosphatase [Thermoguttaceae bacterium]|nr:undecaprenyl-diphosphate phosphatase [Thermoguttaceae bacterium]
MLHLEIILLAVLQGIAEFLPISSSGHMVVVASAFDQWGVPIDEKLSVNIALHLGTLASILVFYWRRIGALLGKDRRVIGLLVVGSLPAAAVGIPLKKYGTGLLEDPLLSGCMFLVTGALLLWSRRCAPGQTECCELSYGRALIIGLFQAFAILPGVSRSGSTIVAGLGTGLRRDEAATFSFLLAIPAIAGAGLLEIVDLVEKSGNGTPILALILGGLVSFVVGLTALLWLIRWIQKGRLHWFAWWVLAMGPIVIAWQLWLRWQ